MPEFEEVITIAAVFTGPLGIYFGWLLSERSANKRIRQQSDIEEKAQVAARALAVCREAKRLAAMGRSLSHVTYLHATGSETEMRKPLTDSYNQTRLDYRDAVLQTRALGPSWIVAQAEKVEFQGQVLTQILASISTRLLAADVERMNEEVPRLDAEVDKLVDIVTRQYNPDASTLPERLDLDTAG